MREHLQIIFQDPLASLDPRMRVAPIIEEPLREFRPQLNVRAPRVVLSDDAAMSDLLQSHLNRYPHEFSGGQAQRIGIARALCSSPNC